MSSVSPSFVICLVVMDFWEPLLFFNFSSSIIVSITAPKFRYVICEMRIDSRCVSTQCLFYNIYKQVITDMTSAQPFPAVIT